MPETEEIDLSKLNDEMFDELYRTRIQPCFAANEAARIAGVAAFKRRGLIAGAIALLLIVVAAIFSRQATLPMVAAIFGAIVGGLWAYSPLAQLSQKLKREYCSAIAEAMGASFTIGGFDPPAFQRIRSLSLVPGFSRSKFEDRFFGAHRSASFDLYEAHLEQRHTDSKGRTRYSTVFRGQLIRLHFPRDFLGTTIVRRDAGVFNAFGGGSSNGQKLERVGLVDPKFERIFEVWGTDQVEARYLVHPVMMERLVELETALHSKRLRCGFEGGDLLIAVEGGNLFEPGDLFRPLVDPARARRIVDEIASVVRVMDHVLTAQAQRPSQSA
jgi:hypothetical protein